jgi:hypothetical protein
MIYETLMSTGENLKDALSFLDDEVNEAIIDDEAMPIGGVAVIFHDGLFYVTQVVLYDNDTDEIDNMTVNSATDLF